jgi:2-(1,2-epoxy-1,2-dihydrophenyl)acetyl-CoA isomerase
MSSIILEIKNQVGYITLNRPEKYNAFNREMAFELQARLDECAENEAVRCVVITGNGKAFCAGQDLGEVTGEHPATFDKILVEHYNPIITRIRNLLKPVVCAVNGVAAGAGANIALCCDIVVAHESAAFIQAFSKIGLIPDSGGTYFLPRLIGFQRASALMMLGDKVSASEAEKMGMIYKVFSADEYADGLVKMTTTLAQMPTLAFGLTKKALNHSFENTLEQQLQLEDKLQFAAAHTEDYQEGVAAFMEKRNPNFKGK